jgi:hypothetical protein
MLLSEIDRIAHAGSVIIERRERQFRVLPPNLSYAAAEYLYTSFTEGDVPGLGRSAFMQIEPTRIEYTEAPIDDAPVPPAQSAWERLLSEDDPV